MLTAVAATIHARLEGLGVFKVVEHSALPRTHAQLPAAVHYLLEDRFFADRPEITRDLVWSVAILAPAMGPDKGKTSALACIDAVRGAFSGWQPFPAGGSMPSSVSEIVFTDLEEGLLLYHVKINLRVFPAAIP